jgi:CTP synthase (UTP-ammonia lyase)
MTAGGLRIRFDSRWDLRRDCRNSGTIRSFIGCQFHPEFKSKPLEPHPLFKAFVGAAYEHGQKLKEQKESAEVEMFLRPEKVGRR